MLNLKLKHKKCKTCGAKFLARMTYDKFCSYKCTKVNMRAKNLTKKEMRNITKDQRKKTNLSTAIEMADREFSRFIRMRDALRTTGSVAYVHCVTCQTLIKTGFSQCGHYMSRRHYATRWDPRNCHAQCYKCNCEMSGEQPKHKAFIDRHYRWEASEGESVSQQLEQTARRSQKLDESLVKMISTNYRAAWKKIEAEKGGVDWADHATDLKDKEHVPEDYLGIEIDGRKFS